MILGAELKFGSAVTLIIAGSQGNALKRHHAMKREVEGSAFLFGECIQLAIEARALDEVLKSLHTLHADLSKRTGEKEPG